MEMVKPKKEVNEGIVKLDELIGKNIYIARIEKGMTQMGLGKHLNKSYQQVQKYEVGKNRVSAATLVFISKFLKKPLSFFYKNQKNIEPSDQKKRAKQRDGDIDFRDVPERKRKAIAELALAIQRDHIETENATK